MPNAIQIENVGKSYEALQALQDVSLSIDEGELFGLIGPDGAGKTTLFRILTTLLIPDSGQAAVKGLDTIKDYKTIRSAVGYMPGRFSLYPDLSVEENLQFFATIFGTSVRKNYDLIKDLYSQIEPFKKRKAGALSGGMKQKLALSCALIHRPEVLFLDEPTTGVDPVARNDLWNMLKTLQAKGITIMASTPYMDEAALCDRIAFLQNGELLDVNTPENIRQQFPHPLWAVKAGNIATLIPDLRAHTEVHSVFPFGEYLHVAAKSENLNTGSIKSYLQEMNYRNIDVKPAEPEIEDTFMELMQAKNARTE